MTTEDIVDFTLSYVEEFACKFPKGAMQVREHQPIILSQLAAWRDAEREAEKLEEWIRQETELRQQRLKGCIGVN